MNPSMFFLAQAVESPATQATSTLQPASAPAAAVADNRPDWFKALSNPMTLMLLMIVVMYIFIFRSKKNQDKQRRNMLSELKKGDRVQTIGGIIGSVIEARETDVLVKVDESNNTKIRFARSAIHKVVDETKPDAK